MWQPWSVRPCFVLGVSHFQLLWFFPLLLPSWNERSSSVAVRACGGRSSKVGRVK
jgi:hypothetical protein